MRRVILGSVGVMLIAAGVAKAAALAGPVDSLGWPRWLVTIGSATELLLGVWLVSGVALRAAHLATLAIFALFAGLSAYQVIRGVPSCGCLGKIELHPGWMLGFDLLTLAALGALWLLARNRRSGGVANEAPELGRTSRTRGASSTIGAAPPVPRFAFVGAGVGLLAALLLAATGWAFAGSVGGALGLAQGAEVVVSPATIDLGRASVGETRTATVRVVNASGEPVRLVGGKNSCGCMVTRDLPVTVPARGAAEFPIDVTVRSAGFREVVFTLYTDHSDRRTLSGRVRLHGVAIPEAAPPVVPAEDAGRLGDASLARSEP